jgi:hypothetical protein
MPARVVKAYMAQINQAGVFGADTIWNGVYPFIDYSTGGHIDGMIRAADANLAVTTDKTNIIPGHGQPVGNRSELKDYRVMLVAIRGNGQSAISAACTVSWTTTLTTLPRWTCWPSYATTTSSWPHICVRRTDRATSMGPAHACSKLGLTTPSGAPGSSSKLVARASPLATLVVRDAAGYAVGLTPGRNPWPIRSKSTI